MRLNKSVYLLILSLWLIFSYKFVDANLPILKPSVILNLTLLERPVTTYIYIFLTVICFGWYFWTLRLLDRKAISFPDVRSLIIMTCLMLVFAYPAFSHDIFNYIATAKVTYLYHENPYIVMPIELTNEPMLTFMHAANKVALYGPVWIGLTAIPHFLSFGSLVASIVSFKVFVMIFYLGLSYLIYQLSNKSLRSLFLFSLNPLVVIDSLISAHNDVVMMFFALLAFYLLQKRKYLTATVSFIFSIGIKYATIFLLPVFLIAWYRNSYRNSKNVNHFGQTIWLYGALSMYVIFFLSPLREEIYSWYLIWPLSFVVLLDNRNLLNNISLALSFGLMFRIVPFLYFGTWFDTTPLIKKIVSFVPPTVMLLLSKFFRKSHS